jgi:hypothetical protein
MSHNIPQQQRPHLHRGVSLKFRSVQYKLIQFTFKRMFSGRLYVTLITVIPAAKINKVIHNIYVSLTYTRQILRYLSQNTYAPTQQLQLNVHLQRHD